MAAQVAQQVDQHIDELESTFDVMIPQVEQGISETENVNPALSDQIEIQGRIHGELTAAINATAEQSIDATDTVNDVSSCLQALIQQGEQVGSQLLSEAADICSLIDDVCMQAVSLCESAVNVLQEGIQECETQLQEQIQGLEQLESNCSAAASEADQRLGRLD